jgi:hypothetical protein
MTDLAEVKHYIKVPALPVHSLQAVLNATAKINPA